MKRIYIIAGEASGDLHGSNLLEAMLAKEPSLQIRFWGGDRMAKLAGEPVKHIKELAFMGFFEVIANIRTIAKNIALCKLDIEEFQPDLILFIDYPGFNLRIAEWASKKGFRTHYYISPQIWAWKENRIIKIKAFVDKMYVILPFEKDFYKKHNYSVEYVGHPLLDEVEKFKENAPTLEEFRLRNGLDERPIIAILPGSRKQEVQKKLQRMLGAVENIKDYQVVVAGAPTLENHFYLSVLNKRSAHIVFDQTYALLTYATAAIVTSGTATLETALFRCPQVVCYIGNSISYQIAKKLINIKYISLVNLIMDEEVVKELIQKECTSELIFKELQDILPNGNKTKFVSLKYEELINKLGGGGASAKVADLFLEDLHSK
ncbi:MAG: lipid-A-disaccharide synthase [Bacteroidetes bacterium]|nr:lipid-A-disaccharide synthase [Bacteroidota bacterium]